MRHLRSTLLLAAAAALAASCGDSAGSGEPNNALRHHDDAQPKMAAMATVREAARATAGAIHPLGHDGLCLDVRWGDNRDRTPVQISKCNGNDAQQWTRVGNLLKIYGDKCLNVTDGGTEEGTRLQIWTCTGEQSADKNNWWTREGNSIRWAPHDEMCLDLMLDTSKSGDGFTSGMPVQLWSCNGKTNQRWTFDAATVSQPAAQSQAAASTATAAPRPPMQTENQAVAGQGEKSTTPQFEVGIHIDYDNAAGNSGGVAGFVQRTQVKPTLVANYVRMKKDGTFELDTAKYYADDAANQGAKIISFAVTVEPTVLGQGHLQGLKEAIGYARRKKLAVEVRFGYEMNGYWSPPLYDKNSPSVYKKAWAQVASVVHAAGGAMVFCPNIAGGAPTCYQQWLPDDLTSIDKMGLDYYLNVAQGQQPTLAQASSVIAGIYPVVQQVNEAHRRAQTGRTVPFTFGETAVTLRNNKGDWGKSVDNETQLKRQWLTVLADSTLRKKFPLYRGLTWFDYYKTEREGGTTGNTYHNAFELSQDKASAAMFRSFVQKLNPAP